MDANNKEAQKVPEKKPVETLKGLVLKMGEEFQKALPAAVTSQRFQRICLTALSRSQKLQMSTWESFIGATMTAAQLGLEPNTPLGHCYLIPYDNRKTGNTEAQFQLGYQGLIDLAYRSGKYQLIKAVAVDSADDFSFEYGLNQTLRHIPAEIPSGKISKYYAIYKTVDGGSDFVVWSEEKVIDHAKKFSQSWDKTKNEFRFGSAWRDHFEGMAKKTVILDLLKYAPKSIEMTKASVSDNAILRLNTKDTELSIDAEFQEID